MSAKTILVCPMDWGLGHATRCIPIIRIFLQRGCTVMIASSGDALTLLRNEFPDLITFELTGYRPLYSAKGSFTWSMVTQLPKFIRTMMQEYRQTRKIVAEHKIDIVFSDNRFFCRGKKSRNIIMTHQVNIQLPGLSLESMVNHYNHNFLEMFSECWIADAEGSRSLAGRLSRHVTQNAQYIGHLSRFAAPQPEHQPEHDIGVLAIVSGPEPQRAIFEVLLRTELIRSGKKCVLVCGVAGKGASNQSANGNLTEYDFLGSDALEDLLLRANVVVCRSGYSSVMDLARLNKKKVIFVPTPGQTEQEYLGKTLMEKGLVLSVAQKEFDLGLALQRLNAYTGFENRFAGDLLVPAIETLLK